MISWSSIRALPANNGSGAAPVFAIGPSGQSALAWVSAPNGGSDGRVFVQRDSAAPEELRDPLGGLSIYGAVPSKIAYAPNGERAIDGRRDVYAMGAVVYEMLTGEPPFTGATVQAIVAKVMTERPVSPGAVRDTVPPHIQAAVLKSLAKLPADLACSTTPATN